MDRLCVSDRWGRRSALLTKRGMLCTDPGGKYANTATIVAIRNERGQAKSAPTHCVALQYAWALGASDWAEAPGQHEGVRLQQQADVLWISFHHSGSTGTLPCFRSTSFTSPFLVADPFNPPLANQSRSIQVNREDEFQP